VTAVSTAQHTEACKRNRLWGKPRPRCFGERAPQFSTPNSTSASGRCQRTPEELGVAEEALPQPGCQRKPAEEGLAALLGGKAGDRARRRGGVNPSAGCQASSLLRRDVKVTANSPRTPSQPHTSILEPGRAEATDTAAPVLSPRALNRGHRGLEGQRDSPRPRSALSAGAFRRSSLRRGERQPAAALPRPATHASRGSKAAWPWYGAVVGSPRQSPGRNTASGG